MMTNAIVAFCFNMAVFLLIGKTSALTMNVAGVVKDCMLIGISVGVFHAAVSSINLGGYALAFAAVCWYNYTKFQKMKEKTTVALDEEKQVPLMRVVSEGKQQ